MADTFQLKLLTPYASLFEGSVEHIRLPGEGGEFGVMAGHTKFATALQPGIISFEGDGNKHLFAVGGGFVEITSDSVVVLADSAEAPDGIDRERAEKSLERSEIELSEASDQVHIDRLQSHVARAKNRIKLLDSL